MAQQLIGLGAAANDRTGDDWRSGGTKINANFTELFDFKDAQAFIFLTQESDFPVQDATTITLETNMIYIPTASFSTGKRFVCENGSAFTAFNSFGPVVTYTGSGVMFTGVNVSFQISDVIISAPVASQVFDFSESVGGTRLIVQDTVTVVEAVKWGTFNKMGAVQVTNCASLSISDGISTIGSITILDINRFSLLSTSATFVGVDIGTSVISTIAFNNLVFLAPAGGIGITGLASSGNVPAGAIASVVNSSFIGGMTALQNITSLDIRWRFLNNSPIPNTIADGLLSFVGNSTETVIGSTSVPVIVNATWTVIRASQFTGTTGGRLTYNAERDLQSPVDVSAGLISAGGGAIDVQLCIALNGVVITETCTPISISGSNPQTLSIPWQLVLEEDDFLEVFVQNDTNTTNIIVEYCRLRVR